MNWSDIESSPASDKIISYPSEGLVADRSKIREIVFIYGAPDTEENLEAVTDAIMEFQESEPGPLTEKMILRGVNFYKQLRVVQERVKKEMEEYNGD